MRVLHTSDWHLGVTYCDRSRADEQASFLRWLLEAIEQHRVDVVLVAGDVFDTANPPAEALAMYYGFLAKLATLGGVTTSGGKRVAIVVGGNHDSASRLDAPRDALAALDVHVIGGHDPGRLESDLGGACGLLVPLVNRSGEVSLVVAAVPFLNDWRLGVRGFEASPEAQRDGMHEKFAAVYRGLADKAEARFRGVPLMATGHLTCLATRGARVSAEDAVPFEINRVGTLGALAPDVFDPRFAYVALGHIHRGFSVDGEAGRVRYSGTPVQVSAAEGHANRSVLIVDIDASGATATRLPVPTRRRLIALRGTFDEVREKLRGLAWSEGELPPYVAFEAELGAPNPGAESELRALRRQGPGGAAEIVSVRAEVARKGGAAGDLGAFARGHALTPEEAFGFAWQGRHGPDSAPPIEVLQRFGQLLSRLASGEG